MKKNYAEMAKQILNLVGGKENISSFTNCVTRLRFDVKDKGLVKEDKISKVDGVVACKWSGNQFHVVVGDDVDNVYAEICRLGDFKPEAAINEKLDDLKSDSKKFSLKDLGNKILAYVSPTVLATIPFLVAASMCKALAVILGPGALNLIANNSDTYILLNDYLFNAFFYFLPIYLGYSAAKVLNINPLYGVYIGSLIIVPGFVALNGVRTTFSVFGLAAPVASYAQSFLPVVLGVWVMSYLLKFLQKIIPEAVKMIFVPTLTFLIMAPIMFVALAPIGSYIGNWIGNLFIAMSNANIAIRVFGAVLLGILLPYMVLSGMHGVLVTFAITTFFASGFESYILPVMIAYNWAVFGVGLGATLKLKKAENKSAASGYFVSGFIGGVTEPVLFGTVLKYKSAMLALLIACGAAGLYCGIFQPSVHALVAASILTIWAPWVTGGTANLVSGLIATGIAFFVGAGAAYLASYGKD